MIAAEWQHQNTVILFFFFSFSFFFFATLNPYIVFCFVLIFIGVQLIYNVGLVKIQSFLKVWEDGCEGGHGVWNPARGLQEARPPGLATLAPAPILERSNNTCVLWLQKSFLFYQKFPSTSYSSGFLLPPSKDRGLHLLQFSALCCSTVTYRSPQVISSLESGLPAASFRRKHSRDQGNKEKVVL